MMIPGDKTGRMRWKLFGRRKTARWIVEIICRVAGTSMIYFPTWSGDIKNLAIVEGTSPDEILLVDDYENYVHPG